MGDLKKRTKKLLEKLVFLIIGLVVGVALGVGGHAFFASYNPPDEKNGLSPAIVFDRYVEQSELVSVSQSYCIVDKYSDIDTFFELFDLPWTKNSIWYRYAGIIKAGVDLETADITSNEALIHVTLDQPYIISNTPDMDISGVLEENNNVLNPIHVEDVDEIHRECIRVSEENAVEGGLLEEAKKDAEADIARMFKAALGDEYEIEFEWRDE